MTARRQFTAAMLAIFAGAADLRAFAKPWVVDAGGVEVDWSNLTARFDGVAGSDANDRDGLKDLERKAWRNGYEKAVPVLDRILGSEFGKVSGQDAASDEALSRGRNEVVKSVQSLNAKFYASGAVQVSMEARLQAGFASALRRVGAGRDNGESGRGSGGLVLELPPGAEPASAFWLTDESGKVLFDPSRASSAAVAQGSMGRWFRDARPQEISGIVGNNPERLTVRTIRDSNRLVVDGRRFSGLGAGTLRALADGRVALIAPQ